MVQARQDPSSNQSTEEPSVGDTVLGNTMVVSEGICPTGRVRFQPPSQGTNPLFPASCLLAHPYNLQWARGGQFYYGMVHSLPLFPESWLWPFLQDLAKSHLLKDTSPYPSDLLCFMQASLSQCLPRSITYLKFLSMGTVVRVVHLIINIHSRSIS